MKNREKGEMFQRIGNIFAYIGLGLVILVIIFPVIWSFFTSLRLPREVYDLGWPKKITFSNYSGVLFHPHFYFVTYLINSAIITVSTLILTVLIGCPCSYVIAKFRKVSKIIAMLFLIIIILRSFPGLCNLVPYFLLLQRLRLVDSKMGLILSYISGNLPTLVFLFVAYLIGIPRELEEAAFIDGCSPIQAFFRIILPVAKPGLAVVAIFTFSNTWREFLYATILTKSVASRTLPVAIQMFVIQYDIAWHYMTAAGILTMVPAIIPAFYLQKYIVSGLTLGAVKK